MEKTILVYDDEEAILEVIQLILEEENLRVITSTHADTIISDIDTHHPSVVLLDIWMPSINGQDIVTKLKSDQKYSQIPVILISALTKGESIATKAGANDFLKKPFEMNDLIQKVKKYIV